MDRNESIEEMIESNVAQKLQKDQNRQRKIAKRQFSSRLGKAPGYVNRWN